MKAPRLYVVIPCYKEEEALPKTAEKLDELFSDLLAKKMIAPDSRIALVDDGSKDDTWGVITRLHEKDPKYEGIKLAHNAGHQNALWAGMMTVKDRCDCLISMDADLQDDVGAVYGFLEAYMNGADVVYGVRSSREKDTAFKRMTAEGFYKFMAMMGAEVVFNHADYRLMSQRAVEALSQFGEVNLFLRGMIPLLGFKTEKVYYERGERVAGESKYPLKKMLAFALQGIMSFSVKPIQWITLLGVLFVILGVVMGVYTLGSLLFGNAVSGWASLMISIWFIGGVQLVALGLIGQYIGKIYLETKRRPRFILDTYLRDEGDAEN